MLAIDADPQASALRWTEQAEWAVPLVALLIRNLHTRIAGFVPADVGIIVIETPPMGHHSGIVHSVLGLADLVVDTVAPTMLEFERFGSVWQAIEEANEVRERPIASVVLLNRTIANARSTGVFRDLIRTDGRALLEAFVPPARSDRANFRRGGPRQRALRPALRMNSCFGWSCNDSEGGRSQPARCRSRSTGRR